MVNPVANITESRTKHRREMVGWVANVVFRLDNVNFQINSQREASKEKHKVAYHSRRGFVNGVGFFCGGSQASIWEVIFIVLVASHHMLAVRENSKASRNKPRRFHQSGNVLQTL